MNRRLEWVLGLTSFAAGSVDVASFAQLGGVLASAMTGNIALLGLYLGRGSASALNSAIALLAFFAGASVGAWLVRETPQHPALKYLIRLEIVLLAAGALLWLAAGQPAGGVAGNIVIASLALAMGLQIIAGRQLNLASVPTVVFTSTLANMATGLVQTLTKRQWPPPRDIWRQGFSILLYFAGAAAAGLCVFAKTPVILFLPVCAVGVALLLLPRGG